MPETIPNHHDTAVDAARAQLLDALATTEKVRHSIAHTARMHHMMATRQHDRLNAALPDLAAKYEALENNPAADIDEKADAGRAYLSAVQDRHRCGQVSRLAERHCACVGRDVEDGAG